MLAAAEFSVVHRQRDPTRCLTLRGRDGTMLSIDAETLIAQYRTSDGDMILLLDDDCPFEERLHLVLVRAGGVVDHVVMGGMYQTGTFAVVAFANDALLFTFANETVLRLAVSRRRHWPPRLAGGARRVGRPLARGLLTLTAERAHGGAANPREGDAGRVGPRNDSPPSAFSS